MAILEIITHPAEVLRKKARKVTDFGADLQELVDNMIDTMRDEPGVGLAAPQVNTPLRVIVVEYSEEEEPEKPPRLYTVVNPEITRQSEEHVSGVEGCLSIPGYAGEVDRNESVVVKGHNRKGQPIRIKANGWLARIFQHEIDHLNGILFIDRAEKVWRLEDEPAQVSAAD